MTKEEAYLFFPVGEEEDLHDVYEERLFEYKQFFLTRAPVKRVFLARLEKLKKMDEAYRVLADKEEPLDEQRVISSVGFPENIQDAFSLFERQKGMVKQALALSQTAAELINAVHTLLQLVENYQKKWYRDLPEEELNVSTEPDAMEMLRAIRAFAEEGGRDFEDILRLKSNEYLLNEMKRVSLLLKKFG